MENKKIYEIALSFYEKVKEKVASFNGTFKELHDELGGCDFEDYSFNLDKPNITLTIYKKENGFKVGTDIEVWDDTTWRYLGNFEIEDLYKLVKGE
jgi:hypothetical protein